MNGIRVRVTDRYPIVKTSFIRKLYLFIKSCMFRCERCGVRHSSWPVDGKWIRRKVIPNLSGSLSAKREKDIVDNIKGP